MLKFGLRNMTIKSNILLALTNLELLLFNFFSGWFHYFDHHLHIHDVYEMIFRTVKGDNTCQSKQFLYRAPGYQSTLFNYTYTVSQKKSKPEFSFIILTVMEIFYWNLQKTYFAFSLKSGEITRSYRNSHSLPPNNTELAVSKFKNKLTVHTSTYINLMLFHWKYAQISSLIL